jgi:hypothetical protein
MYGIEKVVPPTNTLAGSKHATTSQYKASQKIDINETKVARKSFRFTSTNNGNNEMRPSLYRCKVLSK